MSKKKIVALAGLAAALSFLPTGCSREGETAEKNEARQEQRAHMRRQGNREDVSVSHIQRKKDYVKSVNLLLSLHDTVIPQVEKSYRNKGIAEALKDSFVRCRMSGKLSENTVAYNFVDVVCKNYASEGNSEEDFKKWSERFLAAGQEADTLLKEPEEIHRKFVPMSFNNAFLRRPIVNDEQGWMTCEECERSFQTMQNARKYCQDR